MNPEKALFQCTFSLCDQAIGEAQAASQVRIRKVSVCVCVFFILFLAMTPSCLLQSLHGEFEESETPSSG